MTVELEIQEWWMPRFPKKGNRGILHPFLEQVLGLIVTFDLANEESFKNLDRWFECLGEAKIIQFLPVFLVGTKADLKLAVNETKIENFIRNWEAELGKKILVFFTSAKEGWYKSSLQSESIEIVKLFIQIIREITQKEVIQKLREYNRKNPLRKKVENTSRIEVLLLGDYQSGKTTLTHKGFNNEFTSFLPIADGFCWDIYRKEYNLKTLGPMK